MCCFGQKLLLAYKQHLLLLMPLSPLSLTSSVLPTAYYDIYENVK